MAVIIQGNGGTNAEVETNTRAMRVVVRPNDWGSLGSYAKGLTSGVITAGLAAAASVYQFRWSSASNLCVVKRVRISAGGITAFTAGVVSFQLFVARSYTVNGSGGTAGTLTGNNGKLRTSMGTTLLGDVRIISTVALSAGTWTLDTDPIATLSTSTTATAGTVMASSTDLFFHPNSEYPLILAQNEGLNIQATVPATGTWTMSVQTEWEELASF
jgi:hypothetical protein